MTVLFLHPTGPYFATYSKKYGVFIDGNTPDVSITVANTHIHVIDFQCKSRAVRSRHLAAFALHNPVIIFSCHKSNRP